MTAEDLGRIEHPIWQTFVPDDYDALRLTTTVAEDDAATAALAHFVDVPSSNDLAGDLASAMSCTEAEAIADVPRTQGAAGAEHRWIRHHAEQDEHGDAHYSPASMASAEYVVPSIRWTLSATMTIRKPVIE